MRKIRNKEVKLTLSRVLWFLGVVLGHFEKREEGLPYD
jgi:hypothetical protein